MKLNGLKLDANTGKMINILNNNEVAQGQAICDKVMSRLDTLIANALQKDKAIAVKIQAETHIFAGYWLAKRTWAEDSIIMAIMQEIK